MKVCFLSLILVCIEIQLIMDTLLSLWKMHIKVRSKDNYVGFLLVHTRLKVAVSLLRGLKINGDGLSLHLQGGA